MIASFLSAPKANPTRILLVDDSLDLLSALHVLLETIPGIVIVGTGTHAQEAVDLVETLRPDVLIMDIEMPRMSGLQATKLIRERALPVHILLMSIHFGDEMLQVCRAYGADSFISKARLSPHELERQIHHLTSSQSASLTR